MNIVFIYLVASGAISQTVQGSIQGNETTPFIDNGTDATTTEPSHLEVSLPCKYAPGLKVGNSSKILKCCESVADRQRKKWYTGQVYLTYFLETLKGWKCPQFAEQCANRTYDFTPLDSLIYDRFCNTSNLLKTCVNKILPLIENAHITVSNLSYQLAATSEQTESLNLWKTLAFSANFSFQDQLTDTCVQVALYDSRWGGFGNYQEIIQVQIPFCTFLKCGYGSEILKEWEISTWTCMPIWCRVNNLIAAIVIAFLSVSVVISNITVLHVLATFKNLRNSQAYYKASLALADLLVGAIVLPSFSVNIGRIFFTRHELGSTETVQGYVINATNGSELWTIASADVRVPGTRFTDKISKSYLNILGFVTTVSLFVSLYTLMMASFDRFWAISRPLKFIQSNSKRVAKQVCVFLWILAITIATFPFYIPGMRYGLISSVMVLFDGYSALILYAVAIVIPLVVVWGTTIAILCICKRKSLRMLRMTGRTESKVLHARELRLTKTLTVMVMVFSLSLLPCIIVLILPIFTYTDGLKDLDQAETAAFTSAEYVTVIILMSNSLWNCIIYSLRHKDFNEASKDSYRKLFQKLGIHQAFSRLHNYQLPQKIMRTISTTPVTNEG